MKYFLVGFMGSGKSFVGEQLSKHLQLKFVDLDHHIERSENYSITDIFEKNGEKYFRKLEFKYFKEIIKHNNIIISTGGGTVAHDDIMNLINRNGTSFYLQCKTNIIFERIKESKNIRPLLKKLNDYQILNFIEKKISERKFYYEQSDYIVNNNNGRALEKILEILR